MSCVKTSAGSPLSGSDWHRRSTAGRRPVRDPSASPKTGAKSPGFTVAHGDPPHFPVAECINAYRDNPRRGTDLHVAPQPPVEVSGFEVDVREAGVVYLDAAAHDLRDEGVSGVAPP